VCVGDCDGSGKVTIDELLKDVNITLGFATLDTCSAFDCNESGIDCLLKAVNNALRGCSVGSCPAGTHRVCHGGSGRGGGYHSTCTCVANPPPLCVTSYGSQVAPGSPVTLYDALTVTYPDTCAAHGFVTTCENGAFNPPPPPSYGYIVCNVVSPDGGD
jgi:hypothetical protein